MIKTYRWLKSESTDGVVDFGSEAMDKHCRKLRDSDDASAAKMLICQPQKTTLLPAHIDLLSQTYEFYVPKNDDEKRKRWNRIAVHPDPDVDVFLHGQQRRDSNIQICWRADLCWSKLDNDKWRMEPLPDDERRSALSEAPPTSSECMSVSLESIRQFLAESMADDESSDVSSIVDEDPAAGETRIPNERRPVIWRGPDDSIVCNNTSQIRPGDTLVLPVSAGGWSVLGHIPCQADDPCLSKSGEFAEDKIVAYAKIDVADEAYLRSTWKPRIRLYPLLRKLGIDSSELQADEFQVRDPTSQEIAEACGKLQQTLHGTLSTVAEACHCGEIKANFDRRGGQSGVILAGKRLSREKIAELLGEDSDSQDPISDSENDFADQTSTHSSASIALSDHLCRVRDRARLIAKSVGAASLADKISQAGELHDIGKADNRFQAMLVGGSLHETWLRRCLLAKSKQSSQSRSDRIRDRQRSTLPERFRHELLSAQLISKANM
ncbi:MAG: hypothetical protein MI861_06215, partial [Pirellulales bacterium]|nr:hypothetical protein [Pirellulales bacterium]